MDGILLVNKPMEMTSHDVVAFLRRTLQTKKIGHTGTLDPNATGLLVCMIGKATKILPYLERQEKEYQARMKFGVKTDTGDIWGNVIAENKVPELEKEKIVSILNSFLGKQLQLPPMVSAIKVRGKPLYEYAREGKEVQRKEREIEITKMKLDSFTDDALSFTVSCSAGTYIRTLCEEIGASFDTVATMSALERIRCGNFHLTQAHTLVEIQEGNYSLLSIEEALSHMTRIEYPDLFTLENGKAVDIEKIDDTILMMYEGKAIAVYEWKINRYYCKRGLW